MSPCDDIRARAAGLAALRSGEPEREEAYAHARACDGCRAALDEGEALFRLLEHAAPEAPSTEALRRAEAAVLAELDASGSRPAAAGGPLARAAVPSLAAVAALVVFLARQRAPYVVDWAAAGLVVCIAAFGAMGAAAFGRVAAGLLVAVSLLFALLVRAGEALAPGIGTHCLVTELFAAAVPVAAVLLASRGGRFSVTGAALGAVAAAGALAGHAALHLVCPARLEGPHLFAFHTGGVVLAALLGSLAGRWFHARRATSA